MGRQHPVRWVTEGSRCGADVKPSAADDSRQHVGSERSLRPRYTIVGCIIFTVDSFSVGKIAEMFATRASVSKQLAPCNSNSFNIFQL